MAVVPLVWAAMSIVVIAAAISRSAFSRFTSRLQVQGVRGLNPARRGFGSWRGVGAALSESGQHLRSDVRTVERVFR